MTRLHCTFVTLAIIAALIAGCSSPVSQTTNPLAPTVVAPTNTVVTNENGALLERTPEIDPSAASATTPTSVLQATAGPAIPIEPLPTAPPGTLEVTMQLAPRPVDVTAHLIFASLEGGAGRIGACAEGFQKQQPTLFIPNSQIDIGNTLTICYATFTSGPVREEIFAPDGKVLRRFDFTIHPARGFTTLEANDFTALPEDKPGDYRVRAETPDGVVEATFRVTDKLTFPLPPDKRKGPAVLVVGHGPGLRHIEHMSHVFVYDFTPNQEIDLFFFEGCTNNGLRRATALGSKLVTVTRARVNDQGFAFIRIAPEVRAAITPSTFFSVRVRVVDDDSALRAPSSGIDQANSFSSDQRPVFDLTRPLGVNAAGEGRWFNAGENPWLVPAQRGNQACPAPVEIAPRPAPATSPVTLLAKVEANSIIQIISSFRVNRYQADEQPFIISGGAIMPREPRQIDFEQVKQLGERLGTVVSGAITDGEQIYITTENRQIYALNDLSRPLLTAPVGWMSRITWLLSSGASHFAPSISFSGNSIFIGGEDRRIYAFDRGSDTPRWSFQLERGPSSVPVAAENVVYVGSYEGYLYALDAKNGKELWRFPVGDWVNWLSVVNGVVYAVGDNDVLYALDARSGQEQWRFIAEETFGSAPVVAGGVVYIATLKLDRRRDVEGAAVIAIGLPDANAITKLTAPTPAAPVEVAVPDSGPAATGSDTGQLLKPSRVSASGVATPSKDSQGNTTSFVPENAIDGRPDTAWRVAGDGIGQTLTLTFDQPVMISSLRIIPGYAKIDLQDGTDRFKQNRRIKRVRFEFSDGSQVEHRLADRNILQEATITPRETTFVRIVILETTAPGPQNGRDFTAISEIEVMGS